MWRHAAEPMLDTHGGEASGATPASGEPHPPSSGVPRCTATVVTGPPDHDPADGPGRLLPYVGSAHTGGRSTQMRNGAGRFILTSHGRRPDRRGPH